MDYKIKYLKYKQKYLKLKGGSLSYINLINDPNLQKYSMFFTNYQVIIYGENHRLYDYKQFIEKLKAFLQSNPDKKYVIVLEISEDNLNNPKSDGSGDTDTSITYLLAKSFKNKEYESLSNVTFICGDNRSEIFDMILDRLDSNIMDFPEEIFQYQLPDDANEDLVDISSIELYWEDEKKLFLGDEYTYCKDIMDNLIKELKDGPSIKFKDLGLLLEKMFFCWYRMSNIWALNKIEKYMNKDFNIIFITGLNHVFDYVYLINQKYKPEYQFICDSYKVTIDDFKDLFSEEPYFGGYFFDWYNDKCHPSIGF